MHKRQKKTKQTIKQTTFRFWNNSIEYFCTITSSVNIPKYRLKEAFDNNFIGKKDINDLKYNVIDFKKLDPEALYEVKRVKEIENV